MQSALLVLPFVSAHNPSMKKYILVFVLIISIGYLFYDNAEIDTQMIELAKDIDALSKQTEDIYKQIEDIRKQTNSVCDRVIAIEQDWRNVHGQIPAGADEIAIPTEPYAEWYADDNDYPGFYGRLYIPDAGIDVALYCGSKQYITDRADSANLFTWMDYTGRMIADHSNQEFAKLFSVEVGTRGYIRLKDGDIINIECVDVFNGHNTIVAITNEAGVCIQSDADYVMYTCRNGWRNVRIWLWNEI
jgi:hypothetical protein